MVGLDSQGGFIIFEALLFASMFQHIDFSLTSPYGGGRSGRVNRMRAKDDEE